MTSPEVEKPILQIEKVRVSFDGFVVLDNLDFKVERNELRFLIGPNGAGKTTMLDVITGKVKPASGSIVLDGVEIGNWPEHLRARQGIGRKFQTPSVFPTLTVNQNLEVALTCGKQTIGFFRSLTKIQRERVAEVLQTIRLTEKKGDRAGSLSHGEMQWLEIGMLLVQDPRVLLLDEPIAGMTRPERDRTGELLQTLSDHHSIVVVEHDMDFMRQFARQVTVMHLGSILTEGPVEQVQEDARVREISEKKAKVAA